jgi:hypothetical protein
MVVFVLGPVFSEKLWKRITALNRAAMPASGWRNAVWFTV